MIAGAYALSIQLARSGTAQGKMCMWRANGMAGETVNKIYILKYQIENIV